MSTKANVQRLTRRDFIKAAALTATASAVSAAITQNKSGWNSFAALLGGLKPIAIGLLLPRSSIYPLLGQSLLAGLKHYFDQNGNAISGRPIRIMTEEIGLGLRSLKTKSQKLLETGGVDLVMGPLNPGLAHHLEQIYRDKKRIFIATNAGANLPRHDESSPYIIYNTLGYWQASWTLGHWAAENLGQRGALVMSAYDSGYDTPYAFRHGFQARQGEVIETFREPVTGEDAGFEGIFAAIKRTEPDFVYALYHGQPAIRFLQAYQNSPLKNIPLLGPGLMTEEVNVAKTNPKQKFKTAFSWSNNLDYPANQLFKESFEAEIGRKPDAFAVLGYETAQLVDQAVTTVDGNIDDTTSMTAALITAEIDSPRGRLLMDSPSRSSQSPIYLQEKDQLDHRLVGGSIRPLPQSPLMRAYVEDVGRSQRTGWMNAYLTD